MECKRKGDEMKLPCMVICFNKEMSNKLSTGIKCAFSAHASMQFEAMSNLENKYGEFFPPNSQSWSNDYFKWRNADYRKLVMTSDKSIDELFDEFKKAEVPVYMQKTSHDIKKDISQTGYVSVDYYKPYKSGTPICISVFLWKDEHKKLLDGMELM